MPYKKELDEILRVDLAGEYGAVRIYEGQINALKKSSSNPDLLRKLRKNERSRIRASEIFSKAAA